MTVRYRASADIVGAASLAARLFIALAVRLISSALIAEFVGGEDIRP